MKNLMMRNSSFVVCALLSSIFLFSQVGCALLENNSERKSKDKSRVTRLSRLLKKKKREIAELKEENIVLREMAGVKSSAPLKKIKVGKNSLIKSKKRFLNKAASEDLLYLQLVDAFNDGNYARLNRARKTLEKKYPKSRFLDKAYFIQAEMQSKRGMLGASLETYNHVLEKFPSSTKKSSALYGKAKVYSKLQLFKKAKQYYNKVIKEHPGTSDAGKARFELRNLKAYL